MPNLARSKLKTFSDGGRRRTFACACGKTFKEIPDRSLNLFLFHRRNGCPYGPIEDMEELKRMCKSFQKVKP